jgi:two-component system, sensor histidine kinase and response regulator
LDVQMPGMSGLDVLEALQHDRVAGGRSVPVIMLASMDRHIALAARPGLSWSAYLTKPVKQSELLDTMMGVLGRHAVTPEPARAEVLAAAEAPGVTRPLRILLAEDNEINRRLATVLLERAGHSVRVAENGREALGWLEQATFDLVFMDVQMPEMDGIEATRLIRANPAWAGIPIIAMTAHAMKGDRERLLASGMNDYVSKPIRADALRAAILRQTSDHCDTSGAAMPYQDGGVLDSAPPVLNRAAAIQRMGGDEALYEEILSEWLKGIPGQLAEVAKAAETQDARTLGHLAHRLKGAAASVGAERVQQAAGFIEEAVSQGDLNAAHQLVASLEIESRRVSNQG